MQQSLTNSSMNTYRSCPRKYWYNYVLGLRKVQDEAPLRIGSAFHRCLEHYDNGMVPDEITAWVRQEYLGHRQHGLEDRDVLLYECETVLRLFYGHLWRWSDAEQYTEVIATEQVFDLPLPNPESNRNARNYRLQGKLDRIVKLSDGRLALQEYKTTGYSLDVDSQLWQRIRRDPQVSLYFWAARQLGYDIEAVVYDVTKKPGIRPKTVPTLDGEGRPVVEDEHGNRVYLQSGKNKGQPKKTATKPGEVRIEHQETAREYGDRITEDMTQDQDKYFARRIYTRTEQDLSEFMSEVWDIQKTIREAEKNGRWYRNVGPNTCSFCQYRDICLDGIEASKDDIPDGFRITEVMHEELEEV